MGPTSAAVTQPVARMSDQKSLALNRSRITKRALRAIA